MTGLMDELPEIPEIPETCPRCGGNMVVRSFEREDLVYCKAEPTCPYMARWNWDSKTWGDLSIPPRFGGGADDRP